MIRCDNKEFLNFFERDLVRNFYVCDNIVNAGREGYGIKSIWFFTANGKPSASYVSFCENVWNELFVSFFTEDYNLLADAFYEVKNKFHNYSLVHFGVNHMDFFETNIFKCYFNISSSYKSEYGVFASLSPNAIPKISYPEQVTIKIETQLEQTKYARFNDKKWDGLSSQIKFGRSGDLLFLLFEKEKLCGYLLACNTYKNVYDISNVFVTEKKRGKKYGMFLTVFFAHYCYRNGLLPHYGTAVSTPSEKVALASGFTEVSRNHYASIEIAR